MELWFDCCGGGSICMGKWTLGLNNQCRQWFLRRIICINHEIWNGMGKSAGSSFFRMSTDVPHRSYHPARMWQHGWDPSVSPGTKCLWWIVWSWLKAWAETQLQVASGLQKGGHAGSWRRAVIGLDLRLGPIRRKCGRAHDSVVQQG
jgi:hypothetical protein